MRKVFCHHRLLPWDVPKTGETEAPEASIHEGSRASGAKDVPGEAGRGLRYERTVQLCNRLSGLYSSSF